MKRILPPVLFLFSSILMILLWKYASIVRFISFPINVIGSIPLLIGIGLAILGSQKFGKVGTNIKTFDDPSILVTDGLFKFS